MPVPPPEHVIVLALENRSFDQLLGYLPHPDPTFDGLKGAGPYTNPGWDNGPAVAASNTAKIFLPVDPDHSHDAVMEQLGVKTDGDVPNMQGFVTSYERKGRGLAPAQFEGLLAPLIDWWNSRKAKPTPITGRGPLIMQSQDPGNVPVLSTLALQFGVCTRWFCPVPGETWPNRNFLHAATSDGETNIDPRFYDNPTIFELLEKASKTWHIYYDDTPQVWAFHELWEDDARQANWFEFPNFAKHVADDQLPHYSFIEPNHRPAVHPLDLDQTFSGGSSGKGNSQHPGNNLVTDAQYDTFVPTGPTDFKQAEQLIANIYETLRANPAVFEKTVLLITYDEHGGFYDHVPPPTDAKPVGEKQNPATDLMHLLYRRKSSKFGFTMLGPRVPAVVVSPYINAGTVDTVVRDHSAVPATVRQLFAPDQPPLTARDAAQTPFTTLLNRDQPRKDDLPDLSAHVAPVLAPAAPLVPPLVAATPAVPAPPASSSMTADGPAYYQDMVQLADMVRGQLKKKGVAEAHAADPLPPIPRAAATTSAFTARADAVRPDAPPPPPPSS
jgi:phospholipase C